MKQKFFIDSHKAATGLFVLLLMAVYNQWGNTTAWIYLALHGTYGILWVLKSRIFPDKQWEQETGWGYAFVIWVALTCYWIAPWLLTSRSVQAPPWLIGLCVALFGFGVFFHFTADMQKYISLQLRPGHLISSGMMARTRNTNYFGEFLIYLAFALLAMHWLPLVILALFIAVLWLPNMLRKDRSLSRYSEFTDYKDHSKLFIPFLF